MVVGFALLIVWATGATAWGSVDTSEQATTQLKDKLAEVGVDSMAKRVPTLPHSNTVPACHHSRSLAWQAAVGGAAGFVGGYLLKYSQNMVINTCLVGGAAVGAACVAGWVQIEDLVEKVNEAVDASTSWADATTQALFGREKAPLPQISQSKAQLSNIAKRMPGLAGGAVMGALLGYRIG